MDTERVLELRDVQRAIRETRAEMRQKGIRRMSCFNGGLAGEAYRLNARMFALETRVKTLKGGTK